MRRRVGLILTGLAAAWLGVAGKPLLAEPPPAPPGVRVAIHEEGVSPDRKWPAGELPAPAELLEEPAFALARLPWRYTATGVRADRAAPFLVRATAPWEPGPGRLRLLLRGRGPARLLVDGRVLAQLGIPPLTPDGHHPLRYDHLVLGETRFRAAGDYEQLVEWEATSGPHTVTLEAIVGGKPGKDSKEFLRPELGETLVAFARAGSDEFRVLAPGGRSFPLTDAAWEAYAATQDARHRRLEAERRTEARAGHAAYWDRRHAAARAYAAAHPAPAPPPLPPGAAAANVIDRFVLARLPRPSATSPAKGAVDFQRDVRPLLQARCLSCHAGTAAGGLRLDSRAALLKGGASGPAITPGRAEGHLLRRVRSTKPGERMPPAGPPLKAAEVDLLARWVRAGAAWPAAPAAAVRPAPLTTDLQFLRRVYLDVVGVPPTVAEIRAFLADRRPDRRARLIDRLLADPRWADGWVGMWQDLLAENPNLVNATLNNTGPFRYWLHESFLDNKPLDLFATELIRMEGSPYGGGPAGFGLAAMNDAPMVAKANVLGTAFLATEMKCARCHDAPHHGISQQDLFHMAAMLARSDIAVPPTSSVPAAKLTGARPARIRVTLKPGEKVGPGWSLARLTPDQTADRWAPGGDSRERLAALITAPENERFAEVLVNRVWHRYLGRGIVEPLHDWEQAKPSHPELLRRLARELIANGYDLKHLARLILNSHTYQRQVRKDAEANRWFAAPAPRRMTAEQVVDGLFAAFGRPFPAEPLCIDLDGGRSPNNGLNFGQPRRAWEYVYTPNERDRLSLTLPRTQAMTDLLTAFGWTGQRQEAVSDRRSEPSPLQPALLLNGGVGRWLTTLTDDAEFTALALKDQPVAALVREAFLRVLTRPPTPAEERAFVAHLTPGYATRAATPPAEPPPPRKPEPYVSWANHHQPEASLIRQRQDREMRAGPPPTRRLAPAWRERLEDFLWALLADPETVHLP